MQITQSNRASIVSLLLAGSLLFTLPATAAVNPITQAGFPATAQLVDFAGGVDRTEVNGLVFEGLSFSYSLGNGQVILDGGPGITNNVAPLNMVTTGNPAGTLRITLPGPSLQFGYGFALLSSGSISNGTTITVFDGVSNIGSLSYNADPDPTFPGGFAGINSTLPFDRVELTFNPNAAAWAIDNFRVTAVPEPSTAALWGFGLLGLSLVAARRRR